MFTGVIAYTTNSVTYQLTLLASEWCFYTLAATALGISCASHAVSLSSGAKGMLGKTL